MDALGVLYRPVVKDPDHLNAADSLGQCQTLLVGHTEECRRECVRQTAVLGDDGNGGKIVGGHESGGVDDVMVPTVARDKIPLIIARRYQRHFPQLQSAGKAVLYRFVRVGDARDPRLAPRLQTDRGDIAADIQRHGIRALCLEAIAENIHRVALGNRADVQRGLGIGNIDGTSLLVDDECVDRGMGILILRRKKPVGALIHIF